MDIFRQLAEEIHEETKDLGNSRLSCRQYKTLDFEEGTDWDRSIRGTDVLLIYLAVFTFDLSKEGRGDIVKLLMSGEMNNLRKIANQLKKLKK